jgi:hypothetical protein
MIHRAALFVLVILITGLALPAGHAAAKGVALKGKEIDRTATITGRTGACECMAQWYTIGLKPGALTLSGVARNCQGGGPTSCMFVVTLLRGEVSQKVVNVQCSNGKCGKLWSLHYKVKKAGAYYIHVTGQMGLQVDYTLRPKGNIYPLHCGKVC